MTHPETTPPKLVTEINIPAVNISAASSICPEHLPACHGRRAAIQRGGAVEGADLAGDPATTMESATALSVPAAASRCRPYCGK